MSNTALIVGETTICVNLDQNNQIVVSAECVDGSCVSNVDNIVKDGVIEHLVTDCATLERCICEGSTPYIKIRARDIVSADGCKTHRVSGTLRDRYGKVEYWTRDEDDGGIYCLQQVPTGRIEENVVQLRIGLHVSHSRDPLTNPIVFITGSKVKRKDQ